MNYFLVGTKDRNAIYSFNSLLVIHYYNFTGILSKSKGLILRVAAVMHVMFHLENPNDLPNEISLNALEAAQDFVDMCCQHAAFMAGRGEIRDEIQQLQAGLFKCMYYFEKNV